MTRPTRLIRASPRPTSGGTTFDGHVGVDVEAALDGRPPTHTSASDPTAGDDSSDGHVIGCRWINTASDEEFVAADVSVGAAVWQSTTSGGGGSLDVTDGTTNVSPTTEIEFSASDGFTVTDQGGGSALVELPGGGGGGGVTQAYVGYNTVGGSWESPGVNSKTYWKSITVANDCLITSIGAYVQHASGSAAGFNVALYSDSSGPSLLIGFGPTWFNSNLELTATTGRWIDVALGVWVTAGTYWIAVRTTDLNVGASVVLQIAFDTSGSDRTATGAAGNWRDFANYSPTTTSNRYSIRANTIR